MAAKKLAYRRVQRDPVTNRLSVVFIDAQTGQIITDLTGYEVVDQGAPQPNTPSTPTTPTDNSGSNSSGSSSSENRDSNFWDEWYADPKRSKGSGNIFDDMQKTFDIGKKYVKDVVDAGKEFIKPGSSGRVDAETGLTDIPPIDGSAAKPNPNAADPLIPKDGAYSKATWVQGNKEGVDPTLLAIIDEAALRSPYIVQLISGNDGRPTNPGSFHMQKKAVDIQLVNPDTGEVIPNYQDPTAFRTYEQFAQTAKVVQETLYPEAKDLAWGGYFWSGGPGDYGNMDLMHFSRGEGMSAGSWGEGLVKGKTDNLVSIGMNQLGPLALTPPGQSPIPEIQQVANNNSAAPTAPAAKPISPKIDEAINAVRGIFNLPAIAGSGIATALNNIPAVPSELTTGLGKTAVEDAVRNWNEGKGSIAATGFDGKGGLVGEFRNRIPEAVAGAKEGIQSGIDALGQMASGFQPPNVGQMIADFNPFKQPATGSQTAKTVAANTGFMEKGAAGADSVGVVSPQIAAPFSLSDPERRTKIAQTIIGESLGEGFDGMLAVANVIKNRAMSGDFPVDPLDVVLQNKNGVYQFSAWNSPSKGGNTLVSQYGPGTPEFEEAAKIADLVFSGQLPDNTGGSKFYHTNDITPYWADEVANPNIGGVQIGNHTFYPEKQPEGATTTAKTSAGFVSPAVVPESPGMTPTQLSTGAKAASSSVPKTSTPTGGFVTPAQRTAIASNPVVSKPSPTPSSSSSSSSSDSSYTSSPVMSSGASKSSSSATAGAIKASQSGSGFMSAPAPVKPTTTSSSKPSPITAAASKASSSASSAKTTTTTSSKPMNKGML